MTSKVAACICICRMRVVTNPNPLSFAAEDKCSRTPYVDEAVSGMMQAILALLRIHKLSWANLNCKSNTCSSVFGHACVESRMTCGQGRVGAGRIEKRDYSAIQVMVQTCTLTYCWVKNTPGHGGAG